MLRPGPGGMKLSSGPLRIAARRPAIENRFATLKPCAPRRTCRRRRRCRHNGSLVHRTRTGLRHHHPPCGRGRSRGLGWSLGHRCCRGFRFPRRRRSGSGRLRCGRRSSGGRWRCRLLGNRSRRLRGRGGCCSSRGRRRRSSRFGRCGRLFFLRRGRRRRLDRRGGLDHHHVLRSRRSRT